MRRYIHYIVLLSLLPLAVFGQERVLPDTVFTNPIDTISLNDSTYNHVHPSGPDQYVVPNTTSSSTASVGSPATSFNVSPLGGAQYSVAIEVPKGVGGMQPSIGLSYDSQGGLGLAGWGVNISGLSVITRAPRDLFHDGYARGLRHDDTDALCLDGKRLILASGTDGQSNSTYHPEGDPYTTVTIKGSYTSGSDNRWMEVTTPDGLIYKYGDTDNSRQSYTYNNIGRIHVWYVREVRDALGNYMTFSYGHDSHYVYPETITYGDNKRTANPLVNSVEFSYTTLGAAAQPFRLEGVAGLIDKRLTGITTKTGSQTYRNYALTYDTTGDGSGIKFPRLTKVEVTNGQGAAMPPVALTWTNLPDSTRAVSSFNFSPYGQAFRHQYFAADLTGDGLCDIIEKAQSGDTVRVRLHAAQLNTTGNLSFATPQLLQGMAFLLQDWTRYSSPLYADFNGDGNGDLCMLSSDYTNFCHSLIQFKGGSLQIDSLSLPEFNLLSSPYMVASDFNGDGYGDVFMLSRSTEGSGLYRSVFIKGSSGGLAEASKQSYLIYLPSPPLLLLTGDHNADGTEDLLIMNTYGYNILWNRTGRYGVIETPPFYHVNDNNTASEDFYSCTDLYIAFQTNVYQGDFNADNIPDLLINGCGNIAPYYYFALGNGDGTFSLSIAATLTVHDQATGNDDDQFSILVYDFDHDGRSDVVLSKAMYNNNNNFDNTYVLWLRSTGTSLELIRQVLIHDLTDAYYSNHLIGDFNGDGFLELMNYGNDLYTNIYNLGLNHQLRIYQDAYSLSSGKVSSFMDGYGNTLSLNYSALTRQGIYTPAASGTVPSGCMTLTPPLHVVSSATASNGVASAETTSHAYSGLLLSREGKGVLGYKSMTRHGSLTGRTAIHTVDSWDTGKLVPLQETEYQIQGTDTAAVVTASSVTTGSSWGSNYAALPVSSAATDFDGNTVTTTWVYDTGKGVPTTETVTYDNASQYKQVSYSYQYKGGAWKPVETTVSSRNSSYTPVITQRTTCTYDTYGRMLSRTENAQSPLALTTSYTYDDFGNVLTSSQSGQGISTVTTTNTYDSTHRFVTHTSTSPASTDFTYTYDTWGNLLTETDNTNASAPLTTTHAYDGWGMRTSTLDATGALSTYHTGWGSTASQKWFTVSVPAEGTWTKTWHDATGRVTLTESKGLKNTDITTATTYDTHGRVLRKTSTEGLLSTWEEYAYDSRDRVTSVTRSTGSQTSYTYAPRKVTEVTDGRIFEKYFDAWGNVTRIEDDEHSVSYGYRSDGKMTSALGDNRGGGGCYIGYDTAGNRDSLNDASAGTTSYAYNALGQLTWKKDARNKETTYRYDNLNRLVSEKVDNDSVVYSYGTTGNSTGRLSSMARKNYTLSYGYDSYGNVVSETRAYGPGSYNSYTTRYAYSPHGRLMARTFPSMYGDGFVSDTLRIAHSHDGYGRMIGMSREAGGVTVESLWRLNSHDGRNTEEILGDTIRRTTNLDSHGRLQQVRMRRGNGTLRQMDYLHNAVTGNLTQRTSLFTTGDPESFTYDTADRLTQWEQDSHAPAMVMEYDYNGNIYRKTNVGQYQYGYDWHHPFAVESVTNAQSLIPPAALSTEYDGRGMVSSIYEYGSWKETTFTYGPDGERWEMTIERPGEYEEYRKYLGDMEVTLSGPGMTRCNWYLGHGVMLFRDADNPAFSSVTPLYAYRDNQGSYIDFFRSNGTRVFEAKYDPWGVETVVRDSIGFHRGYGGHEMLNEFGIINMNGRLYDPLLGRFLSPDNYVQEPFNTQNLNRYSYCLNNPVKYTDPSGEWFSIFPTLFGIGNMLAHKHMEGRWHIGHNIKYFAQGALTGGFLKTFSQSNFLMPQVSKLVPAWNSINKWSVSIGSVMGFVPLAFGKEHRAKLARHLLYGLTYLDENFFTGVMQGVSRFTWEYPQTMVGYTYNQAYNMVKTVERVDYLDGATYMTDSNSGHENGVTLGNFISIKNKNNINRGFEEYVMQSQLYMHEYGHYIDNHLWGPTYLLCIGVPSLNSAKKGRDMIYNFKYGSDGIMNDVEPIGHIHNDFWTEKRANRRAWKHFHRSHHLPYWDVKSDPVW